MSTPLRTTWFTLGALIAAVGIAVAGYSGLVLLSSHDVHAARTFDLSTPTLRISTDGASLRLLPGEPGRVSVERRTTESINGAHPTWSLRDGRLNLHTGCPSFMSLTCDASYTVRLPVNVALTVHNDNGHTRANGLRQNLDVRAGNGEVDVRDTIGDLRVNASNGSVDAQNVTAGRIEVDASNGSVDVRPRQAPDSVNLGSSNGSVKLVLPAVPEGYAIDADSSNGSRHVDPVLQNGTSRHQVRVHSSNGSVSVSAAPRPATP